LLIVFDISFVDFSCSIAEGTALIVVVSLLLGREGVVLLGCNLWRILIVTP
jgi:hypothetical protein